MIGFFPACESQKELVRKQEDNREHSPHHLIFHNVAKKKKQTHVRGGGGGGTGLIDSRLLSFFQNLVLLISLLKGKFAP